MKNTLGVLLALSMILASCRSTQEVFTPPVIINESVVSDAVSGELPPKEVPAWAPKDYGYHPSRTRYFDLLHTQLALRFDWEKRRVLGKAHLQVTPYFYPMQQLVLDAVNFDLHRIAIAEQEGMNDLTFSYDSLQITIDLGKEYTRQDTFTLFIDYTAKPYERETGGGQAISSDRGLYFINHEGKDPGVPMQIWTQGETQANSCWFPTFDSPNERCTQEIALTVQERFLTVSNGTKVESRSHPDGTRTDVWVQNKPHAPYLFALAVGDFREVKDSWRDMEVNYYMEPAYAAHAKTVFGNTPEMLEFFSNRLGVTYPWDKYAQIVVREFVSGAMENTGCVIFYDALNQDKGENIDAPKDDIIAHELFHHWFGDLVTCESWANLGLNESFASYGEYLWFEHKMGKDQADYHLLNDLEMYLMESRSKREPIIRYGYKNPDAMFDRHTYQKGACVLHMLRTYVGDEAFFTALNRYLNRFAYQSAEIHQLRWVFEEVTGEDLNWFFNQWFLSPGHPELKVSFEQELDLSSTQDASRRLLKVRVAQTQDLDYIPVFRLPVEVQVMYADGSYTMHPLVLETRDSTFEVEVSQPVSSVNFDGRGVLIAETDQQYQDINAAILELRYGTHFRQKSRALYALSDYTEFDEVVDVMLETLKDPFWSLRQDALFALRNVDGPRMKQVLNECIRLAQEDPDPAVRAAAVGSFALNGVQNFVAEKGMEQPLLEMAQRALQDSSYRVQSKGLAVLHKVNPGQALAYLKQLGTISNTAMLGQATQILMRSDEKGVTKQVMRNLDQMPFGMDKIQLMRALPDFLLGQPAPDQEAGIQYLKKTASEDPQWLSRVLALQVLKELEAVGDVKAFLEERKEKEEMPEVQEYLKEWGN